MFYQVHVISTGRRIWDSSDNIEPHGEIACQSSFTYSLTVSKVLTMRKIPLSESHLGKEQKVRRRSMQLGKHMPLLSSRKRAHSGSLRHEIIKAWLLALRKSLTGNEYVVAVMLRKSVYSVTGAKKAHLIRGS